eukprot:4178135-Prymnesium_polylepis.1
MQTGSIAVGVVKTISCVHHTQSALLPPDTAQFAVFTRHTALTNGSVVGGAPNAKVWGQARVCPSK